MKTGGSESDAESRRTHELLLKFIKFVVTFEKKTSYDSTREQIDISSP